MKIAILAATAMELAALAESGSAEPVESRGLRTVHRARFRRGEALLCSTGMGKVNAASSTASIIERFSPDLLVNIGCGGAFPGSGLLIGDLAFATSEIAVDEGVLTAEGFGGYDFIGIPALRHDGHLYYNEFPLAAAPRARAEALAAAHGIRHSTGKFATVSTVTGTKRRGEEIEKRWGVICENMEGGAIAQVALHHGIGCIEMRGISNMVEDRDLSRWNIPLAVKTAQSFARRFLMQEIG